MISPKCSGNSKKTVRKKSFCFRGFYVIGIHNNDIPNVWPSQKYSAVHATSDLIPPPPTFWTVLMGTVVFSDIGQRQKMRLTMVRMLLKTAYHVGEVFKQPKQSFVESPPLTSDHQKLPDAPSRVLKIPTFDEQ